MTAYPLPSDVKLRSARVDELEALGALERAADQLFLDYPPSVMTDGDVLPKAILQNCYDAGFLWVAADGKDQVLAFLAAEIRAEMLFIIQLSVHPKGQRRGLGAALIAHAANVARQHQLYAISLTTFRDVPWNGPYYQRLGFEMVPDAEQDVRFSRQLAQERLAGMAIWPRCAMIMPLD